MEPGKNGLPVAISKNIHPTPLNTEKWCNYEEEEMLCFKVEINNIAIHQLYISCIAIVKESVRS